jgi:hypothetical protein
MNPKYDMKEYNKFPKIKPTPWKNVSFNIISASQDKGPTSFGPNYPNINLLTSQKNYSWISNGA